MATVKFTAMTVTSRGRFLKGDVSNLFTDAEAKELQRLSSVESPEPVSKPKKSKKKVVKDESEDVSGK